MPTPSTKEFPLQGIRTNDRSSGKLSKKLSRKLPQLVDKKAAAETYQDLRLERDVDQGRYYSDGCKADLE